MCAVEFLFNRLRRMALTIVFVASATVVLAQTSAVPVEVRLLDGTVVTGVVTARTTEDISVRTEYGVVRLPAAKLSPQSRKALLGPVDPAACEARVLDLEAQVKALEKESQDLRHRLLAAEQLGSPVTAHALAAVPATGSGTAKQEQGLRYSLSSTGKRHNSHCRYFGSGQACGPTEGIACKFCGG